ncbi:MAG: carbamate kinase [Lactobacillaceae bacterium]|jgi:carbamate kinase|nr:carbamate kinase [Lactobacillaceae bacterium]
MKRIVVALGGNAILTDDPTASGQARALEATAKQLVKFVQKGYQVVITHGNGPQVGNLLLQQEAGSSTKNPAMPLDTVGSMTQGEIGLWLSNALNKELTSAGLTDKRVATIMTRTEVDATDPAFSNPTKPIGPFYSHAEAEKVKTLNPTWTMVEDAGRGYRRVVASPKPINILESKEIAKLVDDDTILIAGGGGGVPVIEQDGVYVGSEAVIDKDFTSEKIAELIHADELIILTAVNNVAINFGKADEKCLGTVTVSEMNGYVEDQQFAKGSMLPKVLAAIDFVKATGNEAIITGLNNVEALMNDHAGTHIVAG